MVTRKPGFNKLVWCHRIVSVLLGTQIIVFGLVNVASSPSLATVSPMLKRGLEQFTADAIGTGGNATSSSVAPPQEQVLQASSAQRDVANSNLTNPFPFTIQRNKDQMYMWDSSKVLPQWMKEYFSWHKQERAKIDPSNWRNFKYCIMRCLDTDSRCGGTADRIKTVPLIIYWAARTKRILMIHWSRPCLLQEFLLPPEGGIDWTVPSWLVEDVVHGDFAGNLDGLPRKVLKRRKDIAVRTKLQSYNGGSLWYDENVPGLPFELIYHDIWKSLFTPAPKIQEIVQHHLSHLGIVPGAYVAAHLRGLYAREERNTGQLEKMALNAINCASNLRPGAPIYFASDSKVAVDYVVNSLAKKKKTKIVAFQRDYEPLHLEKAENWANRSADEYYDTFVDLYLIGLATCVTYNVGGYGQWGLWISRNSTCFNQHGSPRLTLACEWTGAPDHKKPETYELVDNNEPVFLPPIESLRLGMLGEDEPKGELESTMQELDRESPGLGATGAKSHRGQLSGQSMWEGSKVIPIWMQDYFQWHRDTKSQLDGQNWKSAKYLVVQCLALHERCGGLSDRLRPMPLLVLLAARSKRLLLIQWTRPCPLEEFLMPPSGGLNWTVPTWLTPHIKSNHHLPGRLAAILPQTLSNNSVVRVKYQSNNHGADYFNEEDVGVSFEEVFHDTFRVLFEPSAKVGSLIVSTMHDLGLVPGEYAAAHFRSLYGREERDATETKQVAMNGANCASEFRPGGPVFFASDSKVATDSIKEYASTNSLPIAVLEHSNQPLHLDKADDWEDRNPHEYYATFVDLYLLGQSRCMAYNSGGFGTFGLLLSFNATCSVRYFAKKILHSCPEWVTDGKN